MKGWAAGVTKHSKSMPECPCLKANHTGFCVEDLACGMHCQIDEANKKNWDLLRSLEIRPQSGQGIPAGEEEPYDFFQLRNRGPIICKCMLLWISEMIQSHKVAKRFDLITGCNSCKPGTLWSSCRDKVTSFVSWSGNLKQEAKRTHDIILCLLWYV